MCRNKLTIVKDCDKLKIERLFGETVLSERGIVWMTSKQEELIELILEDEEPEQAVQIAIDTILSFLMQHESSQ